MSGETLQSGKGHKDENFPVASFLIAPQHRPAVLAFYRFVRFADDIADHRHRPAGRKTAPAGRDARQPGGAKAMLRRKA